MSPSLLMLLVVVGESAASYLLKDIPSGGCEYKELPCDSGQCVAREAWCDGPADCSDDSDEKYCRTVDPNDPGPSNVNGCDPGRYFQCPGGMCIPKAGRCNDMPDCPDGEDEENCDYLYDSDDTSDPTTITTTAPSPTITTTPKPEVRHFPERGDIPAWMPTRQEVLRKSLRHVIEARDEGWGWGGRTARVVTALRLANHSYFDTWEGALTSKQLQLQLALDLMRNGERPVRLHDLAHYVHGLLATCSDPRRFHGLDVLRLLRRAMGRAQFAHPLAHLALCNAGERLTAAHRRRLTNMAYRRNAQPRWRDVQTYALLAISCRAQQSDAGEEWLTLRKDVARNVSDWQQPDGGFGSVHSTALALQALIAAEEPGTESAKGRAMTYLLLKQDWQGGNELDTFYVLPALNMRSLASLHQTRCPPTRNTQGTEGARPPSLHHVNSIPVGEGEWGPRTPRSSQVHLSLWLEGDVQTVSVRVPRHSDFLKVMEVASQLNPHFNHEVLETRGSASVHAIGGRASDVDRSAYWTLYRKVPLPFRPTLLANVTATVAKLRLLGAKRWTKDLHKLHPRDGEHLVFWYKTFL